MDTLHLLAWCFLPAALPLNLLYGFLGVLLGTLVGVLPGLGPAGAIALLLPLALHAPPLAYLIMLFGITYGAQYGGSTTSILVNIPGEASSVITCLYGHAMARSSPARPAAGLPCFRAFFWGDPPVFALGVFFAGARRIWPSLWAAGICRSHAVRFDRVGLSSPRSDGQGPAHGAIRQFAGQRRSRSCHRSATLYVRHFSAARRHWLDSRRHRSLWSFRSPDQSAG